MTVVNRSSTKRTAIGASRAASTAAKDCASAAAGPAHPARVVGSPTMTSIASASPANSEGKDRKSACEVLRTRGRRSCSPGEGGGQSDDDLDRLGLAGELGDTVHVAAPAGDSGQRAGDQAVRVAAR